MVVEYCYLLSHEVAATTAIDVYISNEMASGVDFNALLVFVVLLPFC